MATGGTKHSPQLFESIEKVEITSQVIMKITRHCHHELEKQLDPNVNGVLLVSLQFTCSFAKLLSCVTLLLRKVIITCYIAPSQSYQHCLPPGSDKREQAHTGGDSLLSPHELRH